MVETPPTAVEVPPPPVAETPVAPVVEPTPVPLAEPPPPEPTPVAVATPEPRPLPPPTTPAAAPVVKATPLPTPKPKATAKPKPSSPRAAPESAATSAPAAPAAPSSAPASEIAAYRSEVLGRIASRKHYPDAALERGPRGLASVSFTLDAQGQIVAESLAKSAGDSILDADALATVRRAAPFEPPPPGASRIYTIPLNYQPR